MKNKIFIKIKNIKKFLIINLKSSKKMEQYSCSYTCCQPSRTKIYYIPPNNNGSSENNVKNDLLQQNNEKKPFFNNYFDVNNIKNQLNDLNNRCENIYQKMRTYYNHIKENEEDITYYRLYLSELNYQNNFLKDQLNIAISHQKISENLLNMEENDSLINDFETISIKIIEFESLLEKRKIALKNLKNNFKSFKSNYMRLKKTKKADQKIKFLIFQ